MSDTPLKPKWIVVRAAGGHYEALGSLIQSFDNLIDAQQRAKELMHQHHGKTFAIYALKAEYMFEPQMIIREVPGIV